MSSFTNNYHSYCCNIASLTQPAYGSGECCGTSGSYQSGYGSSGYGNGLSGSRYGSSGGLGTGYINSDSNSGSSQPIWTNVVPDYGTGYPYGSRGYSRPSPNYRANNYNNNYAYGSGNSRPSYGQQGYPSTGYGDYLSGGYGQLPGGDISWRR